MPGFLNDPAVFFLAGSFKSRPFQLAQPLRYYSHIVKKVITVPAGYRSDGLSVPWFFRRVFPRVGPGRRAAIVHDWLCDERPGWSTGQIAADIFREAMSVDKVPKWKRNLMYWVVAAFGPQWN